jgi:Protein of unknown function (DUF2950)
MFRGLTTRNVHDAQHGYPAAAPPARGGGIGMKWQFSKRALVRPLLLGWAAAVSSALAAAQGTPPAASAPAAATAPASAKPEGFATPELAADAIVDAAARFDVAAITRILGRGQQDVVLSGESARDRERAAAFAAQAHEKHEISLNPLNPGRAFLLVGEHDWPFPVPIVKRDGKWSFDAAAGRVEMLNRRIGSNELDAIEICRGYVEAQYAYAYEKRQGYDVNQYAQHIVSTPGTQDGLAWRDPEGSWGGPIGEPIAQAIAQGYTSKSEPYHGYFFKVLKGQGPAAPHGAVDFVVKGVMIGGFALVAAPAKYAQTGVKTFIVSQDGVVYQKDLGPTTLEQFRKMKLFNPDKSWAPVAE